MIKNLYKEKKPVLSFEIFPPKADSGIEMVYNTVNELAGLEPDYISVTYGAGGSQESQRTGDIAANITERHGISSLAHLTCITTGKEAVHSQLDTMKKRGVRNVLAMRGDKPQDDSVAVSQDYRYASDLITDIKARGDFCIGAACYPEGHIECESLEKDIGYLLEKQNAGADFFITQLFFDNTLFWNFLEKARARGVNAPISAGVMPILSRGQIERMIFMCGASLPSSIIRLLHKYEHRPDDLQKAGIEHAVRQMEELVEGGADGVHIYTMNRPGIAQKAIKRLRK